MLLTQRRELWVFRHHKDVPSPDFEIKNEETLFMSES
jgi:hypothetical protein